MTLLDIVNEVMKRLREDQVTSIDQTEYSALVGAFAYDAMRTVEDAWNWSGLREEEELLTVASQPNYPLTSLDNYDIITNIFSSTINTSLTEVTFSQMKEFQRRSVQADSTVQYWAWTNTSGGQKQIALWPRPATTETMYIDWVRKSGTTYGSATVLKVPMQPVLWLALAHTARERGEIGGQSAAELYAQADRYMSDAVAFDASQFPDETTFEAV